MKRLFHTILASALFLALCSVVGYCAYFFNIKNFWIMFAIASAVFVLGVIFALVKRTSCKVIAFFVNAVAMGLYIQSWYIYRGFENSLWLMLAVSAVAVAYLVLFFLPLLIPFVNRHYGWYAAVFVGLSLVGYVLLLCLTQTTWVSTLGYYGILQLGFVLGCSFSCNDIDDEIHALLASSYSVAVCAVLILLTVLGGDGCDCADGCSVGEVGSPLQRKEVQKAPKSKHGL